MRYDVFSEKWIPVILHDGTEFRVSLRDVLERPRDFRRFGGRPTDDVAFLRFVLSLVAWAAPVADEGEWRVRLESRTFSDVGEKLLSSCCLDLFDEDRPFWQEGSVSGNKLRDMGAMRPASDLTSEFPSSNSPLLFRGIPEAEVRLCPSCVLRGMVWLPPFALFGGKSKGAEPCRRICLAGSSPLYAHVRRGDVFSTVMWSLPHGTGGDAPTFVSRGNPSKPGFSSGLTWMPRKMWLPGDALLSGRCSLCGCRSDMLTGQFVSSGQPVSEGKWFDDPHALWFVMKAKKKGQVEKARVRSSDSANVLGRRQWRSVLLALSKGDAGPLLLAQGRSTGSVCVATAGMAADSKGAKTLSLSEDEFKVPLASDGLARLHECLQRTMDKSDDVKLAFLDAWQEDVLRARFDAVLPEVPDLSECRDAVRRSSVTQSGAQSYSEGARQFLDAVDAISESDLQKASLNGLEATTLFMDCCKGLVAVPRPGRAVLWLVFRLLLRHSASGGRKASWRDMALLPDKCFPATLVVAEAKLFESVKVHRAVDWLDILCELACRYSA